MRRNRDAINLWSTTSYKEGVVTRAALLELLAGWSTTSYKEGVVILEISPVKDFIGGPRLPPLFLFDLTRGRFFTHLYKFQQAAIRVSLGRV